MRRFRMERNALQKLVDQARKDPQFLHSLVFETETVLSQVDYLDRATKAALVRISPEEAIESLAGSRVAAEAAEEYAP
jgi:hypothetical protein